MPQLTVKEQLQYFCYLKKISASEEEYEISRVLDAVHMSEFANQKCKKLSGGMVRRVGIAQAILGNRNSFCWMSRQLVLISRNAAISIKFFIN